MAKGEIKLIKIEPTAIDEENDRWSLDVVFECMDCHAIYRIGEEDAEKCDAFMKSLEDGNPTKDISCPKCDRINYN